MIRPGPPPRRRSTRVVRGPRRQRGVAALATTLLLLGVLALAIAHAAGHTLVEQKAAANQSRSAQAFAAAEAGVDWAVAQLSAPLTIGADCLPEAGGTTLRERMLRLDPADGRFMPRGQATAAGTPPLRAACIADGARGWNCRCPASGVDLPALPDAADAAARPAFSIALAALPQAGGVRLTAVGCAHATRTCLDDDDEGAADGARARVQLTLALLPAVATPPAAALTARGPVAAGTALMLSSTDPSAGGIAVHAGGAHTPGATLRSVPGAPSAAAAVDRDETLASLDEDAMFAGVFGVDRERWLQLPGVREVDCADPCDEAMAAAFAGASVPTLVHVAGDLRLSGPVAVGSAARPVVLVIDGAMKLAAGAVVHGVAWIGATAWDTGGSTGGLVRGAAVAAGRVAGDGALTVFRDAAVLARLHDGAGVLVAVPGSWRDF